MRKMILHPTATAQWQALVTEARSAMGATQLSEELESYLVFLLMRFTGRAHVGASVMAVELLESHEMLKAAREDALRDVGDKCLLFAGFFPEIARKRHVTVSYYVDLGRSAYSSLSTSQHRALAELFGSLSEQFVPLMDVLHTMRSLDHSRETLDLVTAEALWRDTDSQHAFKILKKHVNHLPNITFPIHSNLKH